MALSVTQVIGWATAFNALAVLARPISADLGLPLPVALAGSSVFLVALALTSRALVPLYPRYGAGGILTVGSLAASAGFVAIALSSGLVSYAFGWLLLGASGAAMLTAPAHALLVQTLGRTAKRWIAAVMLVSGLGASVGLPATTLLLGLTDWRGTILVFATVAARTAEFVLTPNLPASRTAIWATGRLCLALVLLRLGSPVGMWTFVILFGAASGSMSVARATLPLELFAPTAYAGMAGRLALPMNLSFAAAPLVFGLILAAGGAKSVLTGALALGLMALGALITLRRKAQRKGRAGQARP